MYNECMTNPTGTIGQQVIANGMTWTITALTNIDIRRCNPYTRRDEVIGTTPGYELARDGWAPTTRRHTDITRFI